MSNFRLKSTKNLQSPFTQNEKREKLLCCKISYNFEDRIIILFAGLSQICWEETNWADFWYLTLKKFDRWSKLKKAVFWDPKTKNFSITHHIFGEANIKNPLSWALGKTIMRISVKNDCPIFKIVGGDRFWTFIIFGLGKSIFAPNGGKRG